jgi:hypothetical protein
METSHRLCDLVFGVKHLRADEHSAYENRQAGVRLDAVEVHFRGSNPRRGPALRYFAFPPSGDVAPHASDMVLIRLSTASVVEKKRQWDAALRRIQRERWPFRRPTSGRGWTLLHMQKFLALFGCQ